MKTITYFVLLLLSFTARTQSLHPMADSLRKAYHIPVHGN